MRTLVRCPIDIAQISIKTTSSKQNLSQSEAHATMPSYHPRFEVYPHAKVQSIMTDCIFAEDCSVMIDNHWQSWQPGRQSWQTIIDNHDSLTDSNWQSWQPDWQWLSILLHEGTEEVCRKTGFLVANCAFGSLGLIFWITGLPEMKTYRLYP